MQGTSLLWELKSEDESVPMSFLPGDWSMRPLGELFTVSAGGDWDAENCVKVRDSSHRYPVVANALTPGSAQGYCSYYSVPGDTLTITGRGDVGHAVYRPEPFVPIVRLLALVPKRDLSPRFYAEYINALVSFSLESTGVPQLTAPQVRPYLLAFPPPEEQRAIARVLEATDDHITSLERMIAKKQSIKQGLMQELLTGRTRLPGYTEDWHQRYLGDLLSYEQPGPFLVETGTQLDSGNVPVLTAGKTFLLGYTNDTHGVYTDTPVVIFDDFTTDSKFVNFHFKAKSSAMKILSARSGIDLRFIYERMQLINFPVGEHKRHWISEYSKLAVDIPDIVEQRSISAVVTNVEGELSLLRRRLLKAQSIKQGMMQELLTGRTRLPVQEASA